MQNLTSELASLDEERRGARSAAEVLRAEQKNAGKSIATLEGADKQTAIESASRLSEEYKTLIAKADALDERFNAIWIQLPNMTDPTAADGLHEEDAVEIKRVGTPPVFDFDTKDHVETRLVHLVCWTLSVRRRCPGRGSVLSWAIWRSWNLLLFAMPWTP